jgi:hypothetical protein
MNLRIKGNSLRLRVSRSEAARFLKRDCLEETIHFAPEANAKLTYALTQESSVSNLAVRYTEQSDDSNTYGPGCQVVCVTEQVGIVRNVSLGSLGSLDLLIGKDFACLDRSDEDNDDTFANPNAGAAC